MSGAKSPFADVERTPIEQPGLLVFLLALEERGQVTKTGRRVRMIGPKDLFADSKSALVKWLGLRTGLAERHLPTFDDSRFMTMLLSSLGFPAK